MKGISGIATHRAVASGPAGPTLVGPLFGSKMRACLDDSYARAHALTDVAAVFHSVWIVACFRPSLRLRLRSSLIFQRDLSAFELPLS